MDDRLIFQEDRYNYWQHYNMIVDKGDKISGSINKCLMLRTKIREVCIPHIYLLSNTLQLFKIQSENRNQNSNGHEVTGNRL